MTRHKADASLVHRDDPACAPGAKSMMQDPHRVGCANGVACKSGLPTHTMARAEYYARRRDEETGQLIIRYFCTKCAAVFAHCFALPFIAPANIDRPVAVSPRARIGAEAVK